MTDIENVANEMRLSADLLSTPHQVSEVEILLWIFTHLEASIKLNCTTANLTALQIRAIVSSEFMCLL